MAIFILLGLFIAFPSIQSLIGAEALYAEYRPWVWILFAFSGTFPICVHIIRAVRKFEDRLFEKILSKKSLREELQDERRANHELKKELTTLKEELRKEKAWKSIPIAGKL